MRALLIVALLLAGCGGGGGGEAFQGQHFTSVDFQTVQDFLDNPWVQQFLARANFTVHTGPIPPNVEGVYDATEVIQINDFDPGTVGLSESFDLTLFNQSGDLIDVNDGSVHFDVFITGSGNDFTIWIVASEDLPGFDCTIVEVDIITGTVLPNGDLEGRAGGVLVGWFGSDCDAVAALVGLRNANDGLGVIVVTKFDAIIRP